jgi:hypothetical protein
MIVAVIPTGFLVTYGSNDQNNNDQGIKLVIMQVLLMDNQINHTIKLRSINVVSMVGLTTKDSCQVAYQDKGKIILHAKS